MAFVTAQELRYLGSLEVGEFRLEIERVNEDEDRCGLLTVEGTEKQVRGRRRSLSDDRRREV